jgi:transcriptional regulator with GAF, ATPase, and Fis domain
LADEFAELARALEAEVSVQATLDAMCRLAVDLIDPAEYAAVTIIRGGRFRTVSATGDTARLVDEIQYRTGEGPCLDAIRDEGTFVSGDLSRERRWPNFSREVVETTGVRSMLSYQLFVQQDTLGALNLYATPVDAFAVDIFPVGAVFAAHAAVAYQAANEHERAANLETALLTSRRIGMAIGILMSSRVITAEQAFTILAKASQHDQRKLSDLAEDVVRTGELGELPDKPARGRS